MSALGAFTAVTALFPSSRSAVGSGDFRFPEIDFPDNSPSLPDPPRVRTGGQTGLPRAVSTASGPASARVGQDGVPFSVVDSRVVDIESGEDFDLGQEVQERTNKIVAMIERFEELLARLNEFIESQMAEGEVSGSSVETAILRAQDAFVGFLAEIQEAASLSSASNTSSEGDTGFSPALNVVF